MCEVVPVMMLLNISTVKSFSIQDKATPSMMENNSEQDLQALMIENSEVQNTSDKEE